MSENSKKKVIIVDDDSLILNMYSMKFEKENIEVETFISGEDFLKKVAEGATADLLMLDLVIPGLSGFDILEQIRNKEMLKSAKIIVLTNQNEEEDVAKAKKYNVDLYIVKATTIPSEVVKKAIEVMKK